MSRLLQLLQQLQVILGYMHTDTILEVISHLRKIGLPPKISDKAALHSWLQGLLPVLDTISEATPTDIDDNAATLIRVAVEDEEAWNALYGLISSLSSGWNLQAARECKSTEILAKKTGFDLDTIMEIIRMVMELIELLRK